MAHLFRLVDDEATCTAVQALAWSISEAVEKDRTVIAPPGGWPVTAPAAHRVRAQGRGKIEDRNGTDLLNPPEITWSISAQPPLPRGPARLRYVDASGVKWYQPVRSNGGIEIATVVLARRVAVAAIRRSYTTPPTLEAILRHASSMLPSPSP